MRLFSHDGPRLVPPHSVPAGQLDRLLERDPVASVFVAEHVRRLRAGGVRSPIPVVGVRGSRGPRPGRRSGQLELSGACWIGTNVVPVSLDDEGIGVVAEHLIASREGRASFFGPQREVLGLWDAVRPRWREPFSERPHQPLMTICSASPVEPHPEVRPARADEVDVMLPASAAMFEEEVGFSPLSEGGDAYARRVADLIARRRTFVLMRDGQVVFKADIGSASESVCQIQGVWVCPQRRGEGLAVPCMAAVVRLALQRYDVVSLYVNDYNIAALRTYARVGFRQTSAFATILF